MGAVHKLQRPVLRLVAVDAVGVITPVKACRTAARQGHGCLSAAGDYCQHNDDLFLDGDDRSGLRIVCLELCEPVPAQRATG